MSEVSSLPRFHLSQKSKPPSVNKSQLGALVEIRLRFVNREIILPHPDIRISDHPPRYFIERLLHPPVKEEKILRLSFRSKRRRVQVFNVPSVELRCTGMVSLTPLHLSRLGSSRSFPGTPNCSHRGYRVPTGALVGGSSSVLHELPCVGE